MSKSKKIIMILSTIFTIVLAMSFTYAFFYYGKEGSTITIESGSISLNFKEDVNYLTLHDTYPKSDTMGKISPYYYDFTVTGSKGENDDILYEIQIEPLEGNTLAEEYVKVYLTDQNDNDIVGETLTEIELLSDLENSEYNGNKVIYTGYIYDLNQTQDFRLRVWISDSYTDNVRNTFNFKVVLYAQNERLNGEIPKLLRKTIITMAGDKVADNSEGNTFFTQTAEAQGTESYGVYKLKSTESDTYPVYFFRGDHTVNNNVIFNGFCWKAVRTTELGGTRLIYNGLPTNTNGVLSCPTTTGNATMISMYENQTIVDDNYQYSYTAKDGYTLKTGQSFKFNVNYDNAKYVGYKYQTTTENDTNSNYKNILDAWYEGAITVDNRDKIEDSIYCNDRSVGHTSGSYTYYGGYDRAQAGTPSVECPNASDRFTVSSGLSDNPVGFLTIDEVALAGRTWNTGMTDYLYNASYYWLGSPSRFIGSRANEFTVNNAYSLSDRNVNGTFGVRPAVSLEINTSYTSGDGSMERPFFVS